MDICKKEDANASSFLRPQAFPGERLAVLFILFCLQKLLRDLAAAAAGVHGVLFNQAVGLGLGHALFLDQIAFCAVNKPQLGDFIQQLCILGAQHGQPLVVAGRDLSGCLVW